MKVIIVGGGFAGTWAAQALHTLQRRAPGTAVTLFDRHPYATMVPDLPRLVSGDFGPGALTGDLRELVPPSVELRGEAVTRVDLGKKTVTTAAGSYGYDFLVLACGSVTNFHGFDQSLAAVHTLDSLGEALRLECELTDYLRRNARPVCVIAGGSYTGVELACDVYKLSKRSGRGVRIVIAEAGKEVLGLVDERTRRYALAHLRKLGIETVTGSAVESFDGRNVRLKTGESFEDAFLCWCAGTRRAIEAVDGDFETLRDGRIVVNEFLQVPRHPEAFIPADTGAVKDRRGNYVRKAVNFALYAGRRAGKNICRRAQGRRLRAFRPVDLGEVLPLYDDSAGFVLGTFLTGRAGLSLHYFMSGYRNFTAANRLEFFARALTPDD